MIKEIEIKEWYAPGGGMMFNTWGLEPDHEMHPYNQALRQGVDPEEFGIEHPMSEKYKDMTRSQLIQKLYEAEREIEGFHRHSAML